MEQPALEKLILEKFLLPFEVQKQIKKFLQVPTPTARLMKQVSVRYHKNSVGVTGIRRYHCRARWTNPPLQPDILYRHTFFGNFMEGKWDQTTGESISSRREWEVRLVWPVAYWNGDTSPSSNWHSRARTEHFARTVRRWTPMSI